MSSMSIRFLSSPLPRQKSSASLSQTKVYAATSPTAAPPPPGVEEADVARLEPRVEERDGYWVLKEKFRQGINPQEKVKIEKEPMKLFMENGIEELAKMSMEDVDKAKDTKEDIDVRLKWLGLFHRRKHQCESTPYLICLYSNMICLFFFSLYALLSCLGLGSI